MTEQKNNQQNPEQQCIFCQIVNKKIPSKILYEDDICMAFMDIKPASKGHVILIPKKHSVVVDHLSDKEFRNMFIVAKKISNSMLKGLNCKGTTLFLANGAIAGQKAPHTILHIIPRYDKDGLGVMNLTYQDLPEEQWKTIKDLIESKVLGDGTKQKKLEGPKKEDKEDSEEDKKQTNKTKQIKQTKEKKKQEKQVKHSTKNKNQSKNKKINSLENIAEEDNNEREDNDSEDNKVNNNKIEDNTNQENEDEGDNTTNPKENIDLDDIANLFK